MLVRYLGSRTVLVTTAIGLGVSLLLELTQLTTGAFAPAATDAGVRVVLLGAVPALVVLAVVLGTHRTPGEAVVRLRPVEPVGRPGLALRWLLWIGGYLLLSASETTSYLALLLALASVIAVPLTRGRRGFIYRLLGWDVEDERAGARTGVADAMDEAPAEEGDPCDRSGGANARA